MYPLFKTPIDSTSGFIPRPLSTFKPVAPTTSQDTDNSQNHQQSIGSSQGSSLPCGQCTPTAATSNTGTPPQVTVPPRPATPQLPNTSSFTPLNFTHTPNIPSITSQPRLQSPARSNINPSAQPFIPAAATHTTVSSTPEQRVPKSLNG